MATFEDALVAAWDELIVAGRTTCPVCAEARLEPSGCGACGSTLS